MNQLADLIGQHAQFKALDDTQKEIESTNNTTPLSDTHEIAHSIEALGTNETETAEKGADTVEQLEPQKSSTDFDIAHFKKTIYHIKDQLDGLLRSLDGNKKSLGFAPIHATTELQSGEQIIEGIFDGEKMIGPDGKEYAVPPNYASKSKMVEGDSLKLTIKPDGKFIYKQTGPIPRRRVMGTVRFDEDTQKWTIEAADTTYKVLTASITFYKGKPGDEAIVLVPEVGDAAWGALENIVSK